MLWVHVRIVSLRQFYQAPTKCFNICSSVHNHILGTCCFNRKILHLHRPSPEVMKFFFMLNSTEYEIFPAHEC